MPKTLMLMRHGDYDSGSLNARGQKQADNVAEQLAIAGLVPDVILHSPTTRAVETAQRVRDVFNRVSGRDIPLSVQRGLSVDSLSHPADITDALDDTVETALVVSHQPNIADLLTSMNGLASHPSHAQTYVLEGRTADWINFRGLMRADFRPKPC